MSSYVQAKGRWTAPSEHSLIRRSFLCCIRQPKVHSRSLTEVLFDGQDKFIFTGKAIVCDACFQTSPNGFHGIQVRSVLGKPKQTHPLVCPEPPPNHFGLVGPAVIQDDEYRTCLYLATQGLEECDEVLDAPFLKYRVCRLLCSGVKAP